MNLFQAVNDALSIALTTDDKAGKNQRQSIILSILITPTHFISYFWRRCILWWCVQSNVWSGRTVWKRSCI